MAFGMPIAAGSPTAFGDEVLALRALNQEMNVALNNAKTTQGALATGSTGSYIVAESGSRIGSRNGGEGRITSAFQRDSAPKKLDAQVMKIGNTASRVAMIGAAAGSGDLGTALLAVTPTIKSNKRILAAFGKTAGAASIAYQAATSGWQAGDNFTEGDYGGSIANFASAIGTGAGIGALVGGPAGAAVGAAGGFVVAAISMLANRITGVSATNAKEAEAFKKSRDMIFEAKAILGFTPLEQGHVKASTIKKLQERFKPDEMEEAQKEILAAAQEIDKQIGLGNTDLADIAKAKLSMKLGTQLSYDFFGMHQSSGERWFRQDNARAAYKRWSALQSPRAGARSEVD